MEENIVIKVGAFNSHVNLTTFNCFKLRRKFLPDKVPYYTNSTSVYNILLLQSGDTAQCPICSRTIAVNHWSLVCGTCRSSYHMKCGNVLPKQVRDMATRNSFLPFTGLSNYSFHALHNEDNVSTLHVTIFTSSKSPVNLYNENINSYFKG